MVETNPYQAPQTPLDVAVPGSPEKATRLQRLFAFLIDAFVNMPAMIFIVVGYLRPVLGEAPRPDELSLSVSTGFLIGAVVALAVFVTQIVMLHRNGWTIGKRLLGIRIVRTDGRRAGVGRIFAQRMLLPGMIGAVPWVGAAFVLVDVLMIFRHDRRCLHDLFADTIVVLA